MLNDKDNQDVNNIIKQSFKQYNNDTKHVDELAEMLKIDKSMINILKPSTDSEITVMSIGDQSKCYLYSFEGSIAVKVMLQYALDNDNINIIRPLIQSLIDDMKEITEEDNNNDDE